nr:hypothetical protein [Tanacetum cinerariifolium]
MLLLQPKPVMSFRLKKVNPVLMFLNSLTQTDKPQTSKFIAPVIKPQMDYKEFDNAESFEHLFMAEPENAESTVQFDAEEYKEHQENPNQEIPTEFPKSHIKQYFTFHDVPPSKWRKRSIEMLTWCTAELQYYTIRLALTFHGGKGLPAYSRIALLDTRQLSRDELVKLLPEKWITNYEQIHQASVRSTSTPEFVRHENGLVEIKFSSSQPKSDNVFPTGIHMITPTDQEPAQEEHIWWDVCNCESCLDEAAKIDDDDEDLPRKRKSSQQKLKRRYEKVDPTVGLLGEPSGKFDYYVLYPKAEPSQPPSPHKPPPTITSPLPLKLSPYNQQALSILHQDSPTKDKEEYLSSRVRSLESIINELRFKIQELHREIIQIIRTSPATQHFSSISQKEAEMKNLKNQLQDLERQHKQKRITSLIDDLWRLPSTPFVGVSFDPQSLPQSYTHTTSPSLNIWASEQRRLKPSARKEPTLLQESQSIADVVTSTKTRDVLPIKKVNPVLMFLNSLTQTEKPQTFKFIAPVIKPQMDYEEFDNAESFEHLFMAEPENAESTVQFDAEEYKEQQENPNHSQSLI